MWISNIFSINNDLGGSMNKIEIFKEVEEEIKELETVEKVLQKALEKEKLENTSFNLIIVDNNYIHELNKKYRNIDRTTDVLSFPMFEKHEIDEMIKHNNWEYNDILGDMVISIPRVEEQAKEYGHSFLRELSYMVVHSFYHLMGYDHIKEEDKIKMRPKEEYVLNELGITRN